MLLLHLPSSSSILKRQTSWFPPILKIHVFQTITLKISAELEITPKLLLNYEYKLLLNVYHLGSNMTETWTGQVS